MKQPLTRLPTPKAIISRLAETGALLMPVDVPSPMPLAATEDSKKPSTAMMNDVLIADLISFILLGLIGHRN